MKNKETLSINDAMPGMLLAEAVMDDAGRVLVPAATALTESMLQGLVRRNIVELVIESEVDEDPAAALVRRAKIEETLAHRFRKAGDASGTRSLYQAVFDFSLEHQA
ncbi:MAG: hypothetical protein H6R13_1162 [Proteobacteria bacterium]|nr:hypothetical protein [Pseudomonadota bacterium]